MSKHKGPRHTALPGAHEARALERELSRAEELMERGEVGEALDILEALERRIPGHPDVLGHLAHALLENGALNEFVQVAERWYAADPAEVAAFTTLLSAYLLMGRPVLAYLHLNAADPEVLAASPTEDMRELRQQLDEAVRVVLIESGLTGEHGLEAAALHERAMTAVDAGEAAAVRTYEQQVLGMFPSFLPAFNNISVSYAMEGDFDQALRWTQEVLERDADNLHALCDAVRLSVQRGEFEEAERSAQRAKAVRMAGEEDWAKLAQALSYVGDDAGVVAAFEEARRRFKLKLKDAEPMALHLTGVAAWRLGNARQAKQLWRAALESDPDLDRAQAALDDALLPVDERDGPWPFTLPEWIGHRALDAFARMLTSDLAQTEMGDARVQAQLNSILGEHPNVQALVPRVLARGDDAGREFIITLIESVRHPEVVSALRDFALSQDGSDAQRMHAGRIVSEEGLLPAGPVRMWINGEWQDMLMLGFEITTEPTEEFSGEAADLIGEAVLAMQDDQKANASHARLLFERAQTLAPDSPMIEYNIATTYLAEGNQAEAQTRLHHLRERYPDYFFGIIAEAQEALKDNDLDRVQTLLTPLFQQRRLHVSAFRALANVQVQLLLARELYNAVGPWLEMWEAVDPDAPDLALYHVQASMGQMRQEMDERARKRAERAEKKKATATAGSSTETKPKRPRGQRVNASGDNAPQD